jgi:hypothetical protein
LQFLVPSFAFLSLRVYFFIMKNRPVLILSACLAGFKCRYDGRSKIFCDTGSLSDCFRIIILCPEHSAGMGIPREPFHITKDGSAVTNFTGKDVTVQLQCAIDRITEELQEDPPQAALLKSKSPSCDPVTGLFAHRLRELFPGIAIYTENDPAVKKLTGS